jgi:hypothetical protein
VSGGRPVAVVAGYVVRYPVGGMTWVFLNYLLGLRDLGFEPVFVEAAGPQPACYDVAEGRMTDDPSYGIGYLRRVFETLGLDIRWWYRDETADYGMTRDEAVATLESAAVLLNVSGSCWTEDFGRAPRKVLVDTDSPFTQIRLADGDDGWRAFVDAHDVHATYATNLACGRSRVPETGHRWIPTRPPVHIPSWAVHPPPTDGPWSTVTSWGAYGSTWWNLEEYRQKDVEYMRLRDLPSRVDARLELAIGGDAPRRQLQEFGWSVVDPVDVSHTPRAFQRYLARSRGELSVAKHAYVHAQTGAFNDRSVAYLATGRPVVYSDTGLDWLETGEGLLTFRSVEEAAAAIKTVEAEPDLHADAAHALAKAHFSAPDVLSELLSRTGIDLR